MLVTQIARQVSSSSTPLGRLPTKPESNPMEHCNAIVLRSAIQLEGPKGASIGVESQKEYDKGVTTLPSENEPQEKRERERERDREREQERERYLRSKSLSPKPYMPPLTFLQRFAKAKLDHQFGKFFDMLKKLHVNIPFIDSLSQMLMYAKFSKEILTKKRKN